MSPIRSKLISYLCKFRGIDTTLFDNKAEWELAEVLVLNGMGEDQIKMLEEKASKCK